MITALVSAFLFVHGLIHLTVWLPHDSTEQPFNPRHSWALASAGLPQARVVSQAAIALASITAMLYVIAGAATAAQSSGWTAAAVLAASVGLVLKALWFNPWLSLGVLLDAGVIAAVATSWPGSLY
ncbi:hypothetical protein EJ357_43675 [Streptomyces cyaneochromogenes]|uniref:Uncharacterized protein n=1 Tax=Streptomyces cyaneochromogenes TaxID=2496836 RepID=A0A3Q9F022_9ACTN|nr:hypothetical protein [Streptomyces cyaneochromogenes]AZQ39483.1 hypothetical protein EJ357_43675 [Streptomyces cyaneochromogenes]